jgi:glyoxylase-like metal-dependent hydrolase (beta-lactamase superfamily II)
MTFEVTRIKGAFENAYLLTGDTVALIDTGAPVSYKKLKAVLDEKGIDLQDIKLILITHHHSDHVGNARRIKDASGALLIAGAADAPFIEGEKEAPPTSDLNRLGRLLGKLPKSWMKSYQKFAKVPVDRKVSEGEVIEELGLEVVALPGHTPGGVGFLDRGGRRAFTGDLVGNVFGRPGMPILMASDNIQQIFESQEKLAGLGLQVAYPGHGSVITPNASKTIGDFTRKKRAKLQKAG